MYICTQKNILATSVKDTIEMSLVDKDVSLFHDLINETFGTLEPIQSNDEVARIAKLIEAEGNHDDNFLNNIVQLMQALEQRTGCIILGNIGSGKSFLWRELQRAMNECGMPVTSHILNPKALQDGQLLGTINSETGDWKDGVLTSLLRRALSEKDKRTWLICDGEVYPEWIESLNSVLDDNMLLTLQTGERLNLTSKIKFIFETRDLNFASPATVSRNAIINVNTNNPSTTSLLHKIDVTKKWIENSEHFILTSNGRYPCCWETIIKALYANEKQLNTQVRIIDCFEDTLPDDIIQLFEEYCTLSSSLEGKVFHPSGGKKLTIVMKNIQNLKNDKYGNCAVFSFLHHFLEYSGFYGRDCTFIEVKGIQVVLVSTSIDLFTTNRTLAIERLMKAMSVAVVEYPSIQELISHTCKTFMMTATSLNITMPSAECELHATNIVNLFQELSHVATTKCSHLIPLDIFDRFVHNMLRYDNGEEELMRKKHFAFEALQIVENYFSMNYDKGLNSEIRSLFEQYGLVDAFDLFFQPSNTCCFSLIDISTFSQKIRDFVDQEVQICKEFLQSLSSIQHALFCGSRNIYLCGCRGSGKKTLLKLACDMNSIDYVYPKLAEGWDASNLKDELQKVLFRTGVEGERLCFHIEEFMMSTPSMATLLNRVTTFGDSLLRFFFDKKELQNFIQNLPGITNAKNEDDFIRGKEVILSNIRQNLSICFSKIVPFEVEMERIGDNTPNVFVREWRKEGLQNIIFQKCRDICEETDINKEVYGAILQIHESTIDEFGSSLADVLGFIIVWLRLYKSNETKHGEELEILKSGLRKLNETNQAVGDLKQESEVIKAKVSKAQIDADQAMSDITTEMANSKLKMADINELKLTIAKNSEECRINKEKIEVEIAKVRPMLEAAQNGKQYCLLLYLYDGMTLHH